MLENFHLATIIKQGAQTRMLQIPLHQALQNSLARDWQCQYEAFIDKIDEIDFNVERNTSVFVYLITNYLSG